MADVVKNSPEEAELQTLWHSNQRAEGQHIVFMSFGGGGAIYTRPTLTDYDQVQSPEEVFIMRI